MCKGTPEHRESRFRRSWQLAGKCEDIVCVGVLTYYPQRCAPCGRNILLYQLDSRLHSFLFDLKEQLLFADRERTLTVDSRVTWRPMMTMMPPALFALSCVADSSVWVVASKLTLPLSNVYMATAWFHAMSPVFSPLSSKGRVPV